MSTARRLFIATLTPDEPAARRIEAVLAGDELEVAAHAREVNELDLDVETPDVVVVVLGRGVTQRDQQMRGIRRALPDAHLVAIMPEDSRRGIRRALEAGADGVVFESDLEAALPLTVRAVLAGQVAVPAARRRDVERPSLSGREKQVLSMVAAGMSNKAIAGELFLAQSTVKCHLSSAFMKLGVRSRNEATDLILYGDPELGLAVGTIAAGPSVERSER